MLFTTEIIQNVTEIGEYDRIKLSQRSFQKYLSEASNVAGESFYAFKLKPQNQKDIRQQQGNKCPPMTATTTRAGTQSQR